MLLAMDNKTWLVEMEVAVCFVAVAIVAFTLMLGNTLSYSLAASLRGKFASVNPRSGAVKSYMGCSPHCSWPGF